MEDATVEHQPTETPGAGRRPRTMLLVGVGAAVVIAVTTSGFTMAGVFSGASQDAPAAAAPAWLTPPGPGDPVLPAPMPGGAPAVPAEMADASVPVMPPAPAVPVAASTDTGSSIASTGGSGTVSPAVAQPAMGPSVMTPPVMAPSAGSQGMVQLPMTDTTSGAVDNGKGGSTAVGGAPNPNIGTGTGTGTTIAPTSPTKPVTPPTVCTPSGMSLKAELVYDTLGRVVAVTISGLRPECGPVTVVLDFGPTTPDVPVRTPATGGTTVTIPIGPVTVAAGGADKVKARSLATPALAAAPPATPPAPASIAAPRSPAPTPSVTPTTQPAGG